MVVFDDRKKIDFSDAPAVIGTCVHCDAKTSNYENCSIKECNKLVLLCDNCRSAAIACEQHIGSIVITDINAVPMLR